MHTSDVIQAAHACVKRIAEHCHAHEFEPPPAKRLEDLTQTPWRAADGLGHLRFMCEQIVLWMEDDVIRDAAIATTEARLDLAGMNADDRHRIARVLAGHSHREKAMRWLGFVQGTLWGWGMTTIDELKRMNAPRGEGATSND